MFLGFFIGRKSFFEKFFLFGQMEEVFGDGVGGESDGKVS
jgi:hypothetical protein